MLTAEEIRELRGQGKLVREIATQEGVLKNAIYMRLQRDERPWLARACQERYARTSYARTSYARTSYADLSEESKERRRKVVVSIKRRDQGQTVGTASNRYQIWTLREITELEDRIKMGQTVKEIALEMKRTFKGVGRALHRFEISKHRSELVGA